MSTLKTVFAALALSASLIAAAAAQTGPDFVFNVPVRIENAPPLAGHPAYVLCTVMSRGADGRYIRAGEGRSNLDIGSAGYRGSVRVEVRLAPGVPRADARRWQCTLEFYSVTNLSGARVSWGSPNSAEAVRGYPALTGQTVRSSVLITAGELGR